MDSQPQCGLSQVLGSEDGDEGGTVHVSFHRAHIQKPITFQPKPQKDWRAEAKQWCLDGVDASHGGSDCNRSY